MCRHRVGRVECCHLMGAHVLQATGMTTKGEQTAADYKRKIFCWGWSDFGQCNPPDIEHATGLAAGKRVRRAGGAHGCQTNVPSPQGRDIRAHWTGSAKQSAGGPTCTGRPTCRPLSRRPPTRTAASVRNCAPEEPGARPSILSSSERAHPVQLRACLTCARNPSR